VVVLQTENPLRRRWALTIRSGWTGFGDCAGMKIQAAHRCIWAGSEDAVAYLGSINDFFPAHVSKLWPAGGADV